MSVQEVSARFVDPETNWRWYEVDGKRYISVTQVLDSWVPPTLKNWFKNNSAAKIEKVKTETAKIGSDLHALSAAGGEDRFNSLIKEKGITIIDSEVVRINPMGWAGQRDHKAEINGKRYILDTKTGSIGPQSFAQCAAYALAANANGENIEGIGVISLPRDPARPAQFFDGSAHLSECMYGWCCIYDFWCFYNYKKLLNWEFANKRATVYYFGAHNETQKDNSNKNQTAL
jgi:hypothetical protein